MTLFWRYKCVVSVIISRVIKPGTDPVTKDLTLLFLISSSSSHPQVKFSYIEQFLVECLIIFDCKYKKKKK